MDVRAYIVVRGLVQGVGYRYFIYRKAAQVDLNGFVKNLSDGSVEVVVEGDRSVIEEFLEIARIGPRMARVTDMQIEWQKPEHQFHEFTIR